MDLDDSECDIDHDGFYGDDDCNPDDRDVNPDADENCRDRVDNDCDGEVDREDRECDTG